MLLTYLCLVLTAYQQDPFTESIFTIGRDSLKLEPASQSIILDPEGRPVEFTLSYGMPFETTMRFKADLVGPGIAQPIAIDQPAEGGKITLSRDLFGEEGTYALVGVSLTRNGQVLEVADPSRAEIFVAEQFLLSEIQVTPLSRQDLQDRGYIFSEEDYFTLNFNLNLVVGAKEIPIDVPVAYPMTTSDHYQPVTLQDPFKPFVRVIGFKMPRFPRVSVADAPPPPEPEMGFGDNYIPGLLVIPGNAHYLKSHFEVIAIVFNAAPEGFQARAMNLSARLKLPEAERFGLPLSVTQPVLQDMLNYGPDSQRETPDDSGEIGPGERAHAEYIVIGNLPGLYDIEIEIDGQLKLDQTTHDVKILAESQILVRSPEFSVHFEHPDAVAEGEPFDLSITFTNRGEIPIEDLSLVLDSDRLVGVTLDAGTQPLQNLAAIPVGGEGTLTYRLRSQTSGQVFATYFKLPDNVQGSLALTVGVGQSGQRISPYVFSFPEAFDDAFPADLVAALKRYSKTALDFAQSDPVELPEGLMEISPTAVRAFAEDMVSIAREKGFGIPSRELMVRLLASYQRSVRDYQPMDLARLRFVNQADTPIEDLFGDALSAEFAGIPTLNMLETMARENESTPGLISFVVEAPSTVKIEIEDGDVDTENGRNYPFSGVYPLSGNRRLVWLSSITDIPSISLVNSAATPTNLDFAAIFPDTGGKLHSGDVLNAPIEDRLRVIFDAEARQVRLEPTRGPLTVIPGTKVPAKPFELINLTHADPKLYPASDGLGRNFIFTFSKELNLSSLDPLEEHITIAGKPALDGVLQRNGRTLIVSSRQPLGPYRPIPITMTGARSRDGQVLGDLNTTIEGNPWFVGVTVSGRVDDRTGSDLSKAEVFLWIKPPGENAPEAIYDKTRLDAEGRYDFPFVPLESSRVKMAVLLEDGRYEERIVTPRGAGQEMVVDFAFLVSGDIVGQVTDEDGIPIAEATVFVRNQVNDLSAAETVTDANGFYQVTNIEVGQVIVKTAADGILGVVSGYLTAQNSPLTLDIVLNSPSGDIKGLITQELSDGSVVPVTDAFVGWIQQGSITSSVEINNNNYIYTDLAKTGADGRYFMNDVPSGAGFFWVYAPGIGYEERLVTVVTDDLAIFDHRFLFGEETEPPLSDVAGVVRNEFGLGVEGATVFAAGQRTTTDSSGAFELMGLPRDTVIRFTGRHPDYGEGYFTFQTVDPRHEGIVITLATVQQPVTVAGVFLDAEGQPVRYANIYSPPHFEEEPEPVAQTNFNGEWSTIVDDRGPTKFTTVDFPRIGFTEVNVVDGGVSGVEIRQKHTRDVMITLVDDQGRAVGGRVTMNSMLPITGDVGSYGLEEFRASHVNFFSDPNGVVLLRNINAGPIEVTGYNNFLGFSPSYDAFIENQPSTEPLELTIVFPTALEPANLFGTIYGLDGVSPAPEGTIVQVKANGLNAKTAVDANGNYRFENLIDTQGRVRVEVTAANPATGNFAFTFVEVEQDLNIRFDAVLRPKADVNVRVVNADGTPAEFAAVEVIYRDVFFVPPPEPQGLETPGIEPVVDAGQVTPSAPVFTAADVPAGEFTVRVNSGAGLVGIRSYVVPLTGADVDLTVRLEATSQIDGVFLDRDGVPLTSSEVALREGNRTLSTRLTSSEAGSEGQFSFPDLPMRTYGLLGTDPDTRLTGSATVTTSPYLPNPFAIVQISPIANVAGLVTLNGSPVPGAQVTIDGPSGPLLTGTGPDGRYRFSNLPLGNYSVRAVVLASNDQASSSFRLTEADQTEQADLALNATFKDVEVLMLSADGTPVPDLLVTVYTLGAVGSVGTSGFTDDDGRALLRSLKPDRYQVYADHPTEFAPIFGSLTVTEQEESPLQRTFQFPGWGAIEGTLADSLGVVPSQATTVEFSFGDFRVGVSADATGYFRLERLPIDTSIRVTAFHPVTNEPATRSVVIQEHQGLETIQLVFTPATFVRGSVTFQDGSPVPYAIVRSSGPARFVIADDTGGFYLDPILVGNLNIDAEDPNSGRQGKTTVTVVDDGEFPIPLTGVQVVLGGLGVIEGSVAYDDGSPVLTGSASLFADGGGRTASTQVDGAGNFRFREIPLGDYQISVFDPKYDKDTDLAPVSLETDGQTASVNLVFEEAFTLSGKVFAANGVDEVENAVVELWREEPNGTFNLVYADTTDNVGNYQIEQVYSGVYRLEAIDAEVTAQHISPLVVAGGDLIRDITLNEGARILGTATDASGRPFTSGSVTLFQNGRTERINVGPDGGFEFGFSPAGPYQLDYNFSNGWITGAITGNLNPGTNTIPIITEDTATVEGRSILIRNPPSRPTTQLVVGGLARNLSLAADGFFQIDGVPHGQAAQLTLRYGSASRTIDLGVIGANVSSGDLFLDTTGPIPVLDQAGATIASLPFSLSFTIDESDPQSGVDEAGTRVYANGTEITNAFALDAGGGSATFNSFVNGFVNGVNTISIQTRNIHGGVSSTNFNLTIEPPGVTLVVELRNGGSPTQGSVALDGGAAVATDANGRVIFNDVAPGERTLKAIGDGGGKRLRFNVTDVLNQSTTLALAAYGEYRGQVLTIDGNPAANAVVSIGNELEVAGPDGVFTFNLLPLGDHDIFAALDGYRAYLAGPTLVNNQQVANGVDLDLGGVVTLSGTVLDDNGVTPASNVAVTLSYTGVRSTLNRTAVSGPTGVFTFSDVLARDIQLMAIEPGTNRMGTVSASLSGHQVTLVQDLVLDPAAALLGVLQDSAGRALPDVTITAAALVGGVNLTAISAVDGAFTFPVLPYGDYRLTASHPSAFEYLDQVISVNADTIDLGPISMTVDQPPQLLSALIPNPYFLGSGDPARLELADDRGLSRVEISFTGVHSGSNARNLSGTAFNGDLSLNIPASAAEGAVDYQLLVRDNQGQETIQTGSIQLAIDTTNFMLALTEPVANAEIPEFTAITLRANASDSNGINRVEFYFDGALVRTDTSASYTANLTTPKVAEDTVYNIEVRAFNNQGLSRSVFADVTVVAVTTADPPVLALSAPIPEMPLPLSLPSGLVVRVAGETADPDVLESYEIRFDGQIVDAGPLSGTEALIDQAIALPASLQSAGSVTVELVTRDLGGNEAIAEAIIRDLVYLSTLTERGSGNPLSLTASDATLDGHTLVLNGGSHVIDGVHAFENLLLLNGAELTQSATSSDFGDIAWTDLSITDHTVVEYGSAWNVDGKGYEFMPELLGFPDAQPSHGGLGNNTVDQRLVYGSPFEPVEPGSFYGGGALRLDTGSLWVGGEISADSRATGNEQGSGGSLWLAANAFQGAGLVTANGYNGAYTSSDSLGGGGGRIAIYGDFASGQVQAYGGKNAGAGTIYRRVADAGAPDGFRDLLTIANHPDAGNGNATPTRALTGLTVGTDVIVSTQVIDNVTRQVYAFTDANALVLNSNMHMAIYKDGDPANRVYVDVQTDTELRTFAETELILADGDVVHVDLDVDQVFVADNANFVLPGLQPLYPIDLADASLTSGPVEIDLVDVTMAGSANLNGDFFAASLALDPALDLLVTGNLRSTDLTISNGDLNLNGVLNADSLTVAADSVLATPRNVPAAGIRVNAPVINVMGSMVAHDNAVPFDATSTFDHSHGGFGETSSLSNGDLTLGTLYRPETNGGGNDPGGRIHLNFTNLQLDGALDVNGLSVGAGGSVLLEGDTLAGAGSILANGGTSSPQGSGGRVAFLVEDLSSFSGSVSAAGGGDGAGAGTVFYRNSEFPNGRLVLDNQGLITPPGSTYLPGLGARTASVATGGGTLLDGESFAAFSGLTGLYAVFQGGEEVLIESNTETQLSAAEGQTFPAVNAGETYNGLHIFDILEIRGGASLATEDAIRIVQDYVIVDGGIDTPDLQIPTTDVLENGSLELFEDPGYTSLELSNFDLTVHFPLDLQRLTLTNGSTLVTNFRVDATTIDLIDGQIVLNGTLAADTVLIADQGVVRTPEAVVRAGLDIEATNLTVNGTIRAQYNSGGYGTPYRLVHGGFSSTVDTTSFDPYGSFYRADTNGMRSNSTSNDRAGGRVRLSFDALSMNGRVDVEGTSSYGTGGSIRLEGNSISGSGVVSANGFNGSGRGGGGRVAVYVEDLSGFAGAISAFGGDGNSTNPNNNGGAGTVFYQNSEWPNGRLVVDNRGAPGGRGSTELPGLGERTVDLATGGPSIAGSGFPIQNGLTGLYVEFEDQSRMRITENTTSEMFPQSVFPVLEAGAIYKGVHVLDLLEVRGGGGLSGPDGIEAAAFVFDGGSIDLPGLSIPEVMTFSNGAIELFQEIPLTALELDNFDLITHFPLNLDSVTLTNGASLTVYDDVNVVGDVLLNGNNLTVNAAMTVGGNFVQAGANVNVRGSLTVSSPVTISTGETFTVNGLLSASELTVESGALVRTPYNITRAKMELSAPVMTIAGEIRATDNAGNHATPNRYAHGGISSTLSPATTENYGTLYRPVTNGTRDRTGGNADAIGGGGHVTLDFDTLNLTGAINTQGTTSYSTGGSVLMIGNALSGSGTAQANGFNGSGRGGGGRVGVLVEDLSGFTGLISAYGGLGSTTNPASNGGAGTVFYQNSQWPNGRLVIDNRGAPTPPGMTKLPSLGERTVDADTGGASIAGSFPTLNGLAGLYVVFEDDSRVAIASHSTGELFPVGGSFPALTMGATYRGLHVFDVLEVKNGGELTTRDGILVLQSYDFDGGRVDSPDLQIGENQMFADGALELFQPIDLVGLDLNNFDLTLHFPVNLNQVVLDGDSTLTVFSDVTMTGDIDIISGQMRVDGTLTAPNAVNLNGNRLTVNGLLDLDGPLTMGGAGAFLSVNGSIESTTAIAIGAGETFQLNGTTTAPSFSLAADGVLRTPTSTTRAGLRINTSDLTLDGQVIAQNNAGNYTTVRRYSHGGVSSTVSPDNQNYGTLYYPQTNGTRDRTGGHSDAEGGAGRVHFNFETLAFNGTINVNGTTSYSTGGSVLLEGNAMTGSGVASADGFNGSGKGGGGRVAVLVEDLTGFTGTVTAYGGLSTATNAYGNGGAGTVFYRNSTWPKGRLVLDNRGAQTRPGVTNVPALGERTVDVATGGATIAGSFPDLNDLAGLHVLFSDDTLVEIASNTITELNPVAGVFPTLNPGDSYRGVHQLDLIELRGGADFTTIDGVWADSFIFEDGQINTPDLRIQENRTFANGGVELFQPIELAGLELDNFDLVVHFPVDLDQVNLTNGSSLTIFNDVTVSGDINLSGSQITVNGSLSVGGNLNLNGNPLTVTGNLSLDGLLTIGAGGSVTMNGTFDALNPVALTPGEVLVLNGRINAPSIDVGAGATLRTPYATRGGIHLNAPSISIAGLLEAHDNAGNYTTRNRYSHGGISATLTIANQDNYGTFYYPETNGTRDRTGAHSDAQGGGGRILMEFTDLTVDGVVNVNGTTSYSTGGSILMIGNGLAGSGSITADGFNGSGKGGGGRVAALVEDLTGFAGLISAYGGDANSSDGYNNGGAGTVFYRNSQWPNGRLVIDNRGAVTRNGATKVPGLGQQTANASTGGASIAGSFPTLNGLAGLRVLFSDDSMVEIAANTTTELAPVGGVFPALNAGDTYRGVHVLDVLEIRGGGDFTTPDGVWVTDYVFDGGKIDTPDLRISANRVFANGAIELYQPTDLVGLDLDGFDLTLHFPVDLDQIDLSNTSSLTVFSDVTVSGDVNVTSGQITVNGNLNVTGDVNLNDNALTVTGQITVDGTLSMSDGARLAVNGELNAANPLTLVSGAILTLDGKLTAPSFTVATGGQLLTPYRTRGGIHINAAVIAIDGALVAHDNAGNYGTRERYSHGGISATLTVANQDNYGTFYYPDTNGTRDRTGAHSDAQGGGGRVYLEFTSLSVNGNVNANGTTSYATGGSIYLRGGSVAGAGTITADGFNGSGKGGGGRVAVHVEDLSGFTGLISAYGGDANTTDGYNNGGAGTVFYRNSQWPNGRLVIDNRGAVTRASTTKLPSLGVQTATASTGGTVIAGSFPTLNGLAGMHVLFEDGSTAAIASNSGSELIPETSFPALSAGETYTGIHILDVLEVKGGASLATADEIRVLDSFVFNGGIIDTPNLELPEDTFFSNGAIEVIRGLQPFALELDNFQFIFHDALALDRIALNNGANLIVYDNVNVETDVTLNENGFGVIGTLTVGGALDLGTGQLGVEGVLQVPNSAVTVDSSLLTLNGRLEAPGLTVTAAGVISTPPVDGAEIHLDVPDMTIAGQVFAHDNPGTYTGNRLRYAHGGYASFTNFNTYDTYGSLYRADTAGSLNGAGGHVRLTFDNLELTGLVSANATVSYGSGGSVLLEGDTLTGTGPISADGFFTTNPGGGGRIAFYVENLSGYSGTVTAYGGDRNSTNLDYNGGAGTIFYRNSQWPNGRLVIDNRGVVTNSGSTYLPSLGERTAGSNTGGASIAGSGYPVRDGLAGLYVVYPDNSLHAVAGNSGTEIFPETNFPSLSSGLTYSGRHIFDVLELRGAANLATDDAIEIVQQLIQDPGTTISTPDLIFPTVAKRLATTGKSFTGDRPLETLDVTGETRTLSGVVRADRVFVGPGGSLTIDGRLEAGSVEIDGGELWVKGAADGATATLSASRVRVQSGLLAADHIQVRGAFILEPDASLNLAGPGVPHDGSRTMLHLKAHMIQLDGIVERAAASLRAETSDFRSEGGTVAGELIVDGGLWEDVDLRVGVLRALRSLTVKSGNLTVGQIEAPDFQVGEALILETLKAGGNGERTIRLNLDGEIQWLEVTEPLEPTNPESTRSEVPSPKAPNPESPNPEPPNPENNETP